MIAPNFVRAVAVVIGVTLCATLPAAVIPYSVDSATLHLWHLNEPALPCVDSAPGGTNLVILAGGATLGNPSFAGFGSALSTIDGGQTGITTTSRNASLSPRTLTSGSGDNVAMPFASAINGAFTFEAIVRINFNPALNLGPSGTGRDAALQILSGDGDVDADRLFQWRLNPVGFGGGDSSVPRLEFINLRQGVAMQSVIVSVPTNGPHAILSNAWYHVAVAYDGNQNTAGNFRVHWTALSSTNASANLIGTANLSNDLSAVVSCDFVVGNEGRTTVSENFIGLIDEVRISNVARRPYEFVFIAVDADTDGLPDEWETAYFPSHTTWGAADDPDNDGFTNVQEYGGRSNPALQASTPDDTDGDTLPDAWENTYFSSITPAAGDDSDQDGFTNAQEFAAGTNPTNAVSNPDDVDADGLPDAWENTHFGSLVQSGSDDPDGDGYTNLQEFQYGTQPDVPGILPPSAPRFFPIDDGDPNTSEYGFAGNSAINTVAFVCSQLLTASNQQFIAYYGRHQTDSSYAFNNTIWFARRTIGSNIWEVFRTTFVANNINDGHDVVSFAIDGDGYMHMSWGMHGDAFHYARSTNPVTGSLPIGFGPDSSMTGNENSVTYPQWIRLPDGDLLYLFREGTSGDGDAYLNRYFRASQTWVNVHSSGSTQLPFLRGSTWTPDYNPYPNMPCVDAAGNLYLVWTWRYEPGGNDSPANENGYQTNHDFDYARSPDGGITWLRSDGTPYALPISQDGENGDTNTVAEKVLSIPEGYSLINQAGMCLDSQNQPVIATWWAPGTGTNNFRRQYMVGFPGTNGVWQTRQVSQRTNDAINSKKDESVVRDLGRPIVVCDDQDRIIVLYRDNQGSNGLTIVHSLPRAVDPERLIWTTIDLTTDNLGFYEPVIDLARWQQSRVLSIVYQPSAGLGYTPPANNAARIGVVEWDAAAYFAHRPALSAALVNEGHDLSLSFPSQVGWNYRLQSSTNFTTWENVATLNGTGGSLQHVQTNATTIRQFWRLEVKEGGFTP